MSASIRAKLLVALFGVVLIAFQLSGCYGRTTRGDATVYACTAWALILSIAAGVIAVPAGIWVARTYPDYSPVGWTMATAGPLAVVLLGPTLAQEHVLVDARHFEYHGGVWFARKHHVVGYDEMARLRRVKEERKGARMLIEKKSGAVEDLPLGDLMRRAAPEIVERARKRGVPTEGWD
jgi:hypothetical protein